MKKSLKEVLEAHRTDKEYFTPILKEATKWLNDNDIDYTHWTEEEIIRHHYINCPDYGVEPVSETVNEGIEGIFRNLIDNYGIESGDITPMQQVSLDEVQNRLTELCEGWVISRTGSDKV